MAFALKKKKHAAKRLRHIVISQLYKAAVCVADDGRLTDKEIHNARKAIKRARATLRLLKPRTSRTVFSETNMALRDVARPLTAVRDATALRNALDALVSQGVGVDQTSLARLRQRLNKERVNARRHLNRSETILPHVRVALRTLHRDAERLSPDADGWRLIGAAVRQIYARARRAYGKVLSERSDESLHEWRKQVKHLWYMLQIMTPMRPSYVDQCAALAHRLTELLGDDHDLANLQLWLTSLSPGPASMGPLLMLIDRRRYELQDRAFAIGECFLTRKSKRFSKSVRRLWRDWHDEPKVYRMTVSQEVFASRERRPPVTDTREVHRLH